MAFGSVLLRVTAGGLFMGHGLQKLTGAFGGPGLDQAAGMMTSLNMHPGRQHALAASSAETFGGAALLLGAATPAAAAALVATMLTAVRKVHIKNGPWVGNGGWEYNALLAAAAVAVAADGPGVLSVDAIFKKSRWGIAGGLFAIGAGIVGSFAATEYGKRNAPAPEPGTGAETPAS